jgi:cytochrome d ubiquinol oxidase subunit I
MNWSTYSRFVGDIFGVPLAIEAMLAFFLESTFIGIWIFGWERLSKGLHAATIWLVAIGANLSALWILIANGWMHHPVGYVINNGRAELTDFSALILNPKAWLFFWHTIAAGFVTAAFFVLGISAYHLARKRDVDAFRYSFRLAAIIGVIASLMVVLGGHLQGNYLRIVEPMAAAASEAHYETQDPADFTLVAIFNAEGEAVWSIKFPKMLSMLYYLKPEGEVEGMNDIQNRYRDQYGPGNYFPPVALNYWTFRIMVGVGFLMIALAVWALYISLKHRAGKQTRWIKLFTWAILLPYIANTAGWILTETSRQPWIVTGLLKTVDAASPNVNANLVLLSLVGFTLIYALLMVADVFLLVKYAKVGISVNQIDSPIPAVKSVVY